MNRLDSVYHRSSFPDKGRRRIPPETESEERREDPSSHQRRRCRRRPDPRSLSGGRTGPDGRCAPFDAARRSSVGGSPIPGASLPEAGSGTVLRSPAGGRADRRKGTGAAPLSRQPGRSDRRSAEGPVFPPGDRHHPQRPPAGLSGTSLGPDELRDSQRLGSPADGRAGVCVRRHGGGIPGQGVPRRVFHP